MGVMLHYCIWAPDNLHEGMKFQQKGEWHVDQADHLFRKVPHFLSFGQFQVCVQSYDASLTFV